MRLHRLGQALVFATMFAAPASMGAWPQGDDGKPAGFTVDAAVRSFVRAWNARDARAAAFYVAGAVPLERLTTALRSATPRITLRLQKVMLKESGMNAAGELHLAVTRRRAPGRAETWSVREAVAMRRTHGVWQFVPKPSKGFHAELSAPRPKIVVGVLTAALASPDHFDR